MTFTFERRLHTFKQFNWPHTSSKTGASKLTKYKSQPEDFAQAGFYCRPLVGSTDTVACFMCLKNLDGWEAGDSAWNEHKSHSPQCPLVTLNLCSSRMKTFEKWPGAAVKGGTAALAEAGFFHFPKVDNDDTCICFQCGLALDGWEEGDDPDVEHGRRRPNCPHVAMKQYIKPASFDFILKGQSDDLAVKEISKVVVDVESQSEQTPMKESVQNHHQITMTTTTTCKKIKLNSEAGNKKITISVPKEDKENLSHFNNNNNSSNGVSSNVVIPPPTSTRKKAQQAQTPTSLNNNSSSHFSEIFKIFPEFHQVDHQSLMDMSVQDFIGQVITEKVEAFQMLLSKSSESTSTSTK